MNAYYSLMWQERGALRVLDQRLLPHEVVYRETADYQEVADMIRDMTVRGAPAIGAAAAYGLALAALHSRQTSLSGLLVDLSAAAQVLQSARPTAVNLFWAVQRVLQAGQAASTPAELKAAVLQEAHAVAEEDILTNEMIGLQALPLVPQQAVFVHHCNTGALATVRHGTALGIIAAAHAHGRQVFVYIDETRPRLQGARLTAWELDQLGIPHALIVDGASGMLMKTRKVDLCTVGCDRVAANGDTANKIGTYNLALAAQAHGVPFYVAAPTSTIDLATPSGAEIPIEERAAEEITLIGAERIAPLGTQVFNPAFDVTPAACITAIITEAGVARPPYNQSLPEMVAKAQALHAGLAHSRR